MAVKFVYPLFSTNAPYQRGKGVKQNLLGWTVELFELIATYDGRKKDRHRFQYNLGNDSGNENTFIDTAKDNLL